MDVEIVHGCSNSYRNSAVSIYYLALAQKLAPALGDKKKAIHFIVNNLNEQNCMLAFVNGKLVGVLGVQDSEGSFLDIRIRKLIVQYGLLRGLWAFLLLSVLNRKVEPGEFYLDGIAVIPEFRGKGVGTRLIRAFETLGHSQHKQWALLEVVNTNNSAQRLYKKLGYSEESIEQLGFFKLIFGFSSAALMRKKLVD